MIFRAFVVFLLFAVFAGTDGNINVTMKVPCVSDESCKKFFESISQKADVKCIQGHCMCPDPESQQGGVRYDYCKPGDKVAEKAQMAPKNEKSGRSLEAKPCDIHEDCRDIKGSICAFSTHPIPRSGKICVCSEGTTFNEERNQCIEKQDKYEGKCIENIQCSEGELRMAYCEKSNSTSEFGKCVCLAFAHLHDRKKCVVTKREGEICLEKFEGNCYDPQKNLTCHNNKCVEIKKDTSSGAASMCINFILKIVPVLIFGTSISKN